MVFQLTEDTDVNTLTSLNCMLVASNADILCLVLQQNLIYYKAPIGKNLDPIVKGSRVDQGTPCIFNSRASGIENVLQNALCIWLARHEC